MILISLCGKINFFPYYDVLCAWQTILLCNNSATVLVVFCKNSEVESKTRELFSSNEFGKLRSRQSNVRGEFALGYARKFVTWQTNYITQMKCILPYMSKKKKKKKKLNSTLL